MSAQRTRETEQQLPLLASAASTRRAHAVVYLRDHSIFVNLEPGRTVVLGRSEEADVVIDTSTVSRRHLALCWGDGRLTARDCGSTNGSFVDGQPLIGETTLRGGEEIMIGDAQVVVGLITAPRSMNRLLDESEPSLEGRAASPVASDPVTRQLFALVERVAPTESTVLVVGETGAGKDVVASELHRRSGRAEGPFVHVNCGAIPPTIFAREMFGHEPGAFTGARERSPGLFEAAQGGTLFLDEVAEIPLSEQPRLLRVLEHHTLTRVGGVEEISLDLRIVAATNRDLEQLVEQGLFREDLLYRLNVITLFVPALRDRPGDVEVLAKRFFVELARACEREGLRLSTEALEVLARFDWPGNVRELKNVIERLVLLATGEEVAAAEALEVLYGAALPSFGGAREVDLKALVEEVEREAIRRALAACGQNQSVAARRLGISRRALIYKMQRYGIPGRRG